MNNFIGIDAHSKTCVFVNLNQRGELICKARIPTEELALLDYVSGIQGTKHLALEESGISQWLYLLLKDKVDKLTVCHPGLLSPRAGAKGDFKDAWLIADDLRCNKLVSVYHDDSKLFELRKLVSGYADIVSDLTRTKNRYKSIYRSLAIGVDGTTIYRDKHRIKTLSTNFEKFVATTLFDQIQHQTKTKEIFESEFLARSKEFPQIKKLCSIPGIAETRACIIAATVVSPDRFPNKHKFWGYCKLVKYQDISDGKLYGTRIPLGRPDLKNVFMGAAERCLISGKNSLRRYYDQLRSKGIGHKNAKKAVARRIAATALAIMKTNKKYDDKYEEKKARKLKNKT